MLKQVVQDILENNRNRSIAIVTSVRYGYSVDKFDNAIDCYCKLSAYSPDLRQTIRIDESLSADQSEKDLIASCAVGDIISYHIHRTESECGIPENVYTIARNISGEQRLNIFREAFATAFSKMK